MPTAMIWGASGGIGRALAERLLQGEWRVIAISRDETAVPDGVAANLEIIDIADPFAIEAAVREAAYEADSVDLWVYAVGDILATPVADLKQEAWTRILNANLTGAYLSATHSLPLLAEEAHMIFLGAISERLRLPGLSAYAAAKAGLEAFGEAFQKEQRKKRVSVVRPGAVATALWDKVPMKLPKDAMSADAVADKILEAFAGGHKGQLDLTH